MNYIFSLFCVLLLWLFNIFVHAVENFFNKKIDQKLKKLHIGTQLNQEARKIGIPARAVRDNDSNRTTSVRQLEKGYNCILYTLLLCLN